MVREKLDKLRTELRRRMRRITVASVVSNIAVPQILNALFAALSAWYVEAELSRTEQVGLFLYVYTILALCSVLLAFAWRLLFPKNAPPSENDEFISGMRKALAGMVTGPPIALGRPSHLAPPERTVQSIEELLHLYKGRTRLQGDELFRRYEGSELETSGLVSEVTGGIDLTCSLKRPSGATVLCGFNAEAREHLVKLQVGDQLKVRGQIGSSPTLHIISLRNCEIL